MTANVETKATLQSDGTIQIEIFEKSSQSLFTFILAQAAAKELRSQIGEALLADLPPQVNGGCFGNNIHPALAAIERNKNKPTSIYLMLLQLILNQMVKFHLKCSVQAANRHLNVACQV